VQESGTESTEKDIEKGFFDEFEQLLQELASLKITAAQDMTDLEEDVDGDDEDEDEGMIVTSPVTSFPSLQDVDDDGTSDVSPKSRGAIEDPPTKQGQLQLTEELKQMESDLLALKKLACEGLDDDEELVGQDEADECDAYADEENALMENLDNLEQAMLL